MFEERPWFSLCPLRPPSPTPPAEYVDVCFESELRALAISLFLSLCVCSPCSGVWRSHNWSGVWTHSVSRISRSVRQQPSLYLDYRGRYGQDHQVIRRRRKETIRVCGVACLCSSLFCHSVLQKGLGYGLRS